MERILLKKTCNQVIIFFIASILLLSSSNILNAQINAKFNYSLNSKCATAKANFIIDTTGYGTEIVTFKWDFDDGNGFNTISVNNQINFDYYFRNPGTYTVKLETTNKGVTNIASKVITCYQSPTAKMQVVGGKGCGDITAQFNDQSIAGSAAIISREWVLQNGDKVTGTNPTYKYTIPGKYDVDLVITDANGCTDFQKFKDAIEVLPALDAGFSSDRTFLCSPGYIKFKDTTHTTLALKYKWYFGNGVTSTLKEPLVEFRNNGFYNITLVVENEFGCYDSIVRPNYISINQDEAKFQIFDESNKAVLNKDTVCPGEIFFKNNSVQGITSNWYINNVKMSSAYIENNRDLRYPLDKSGLTIIKLTVGSSGCISSKTDTIYIDELEANFDFTDADACAVPKLISVTNSSVNATNYIWDFEDGSRAFNETPNHLINAVDTINAYGLVMDRAEYKVKLTAINARGCVNVKEKIYNFVFPKARIVPMKFNGCAPFYDEFYSRSLSLDRITDHKWIFDDGNINNTGMVSSTSNIYNNVGTYNAYLIITNEKGCIDTSNRVIIHVGPVVQPTLTVSPDTVCTNDILSITNTTISPYKFNSVHYSSPGVFSVYGDNSGTTNVDILSEKLYESDIFMEVEINGCLSDTLIKDVYYIEGPLAKFDLYTTCANPLEYNFHSASEDYESIIWNFGDGNSSNIQDTIKSYAEGKYTVTLTATNSKTGCPDDIRTKNIIVQDPNAYYESTPDTFICVSNFPVSEFDGTDFNGSNSSGYDEECNNMPFRWNFGYNDIWEIKDSPFNSHTFTTKYSPNINISLAVEDSKGCVDTLTREYDLIEPSAEFVIDTSSGCFPEFPVKFTFDSAANPTVKTWYWEYDNISGIQDSNIAKPTYTYKSKVETTLNPQLTVVDIYGCDNRESQNIMFIVPNPDFYHSTKDNSYYKEYGACLNNNMYFKPTPFYTSDSSHWEIEDSTILEKTPSYTFNNVGFKKVIHHVYKNGCTDTTSTIIEIEEAIADFFAYDTVQACNMNMRFYHKLENGTVNKNSNYSKWTFDAEGNWSEYKDDTVYFSYSEPGKHTPKLAITTKYGCQDTSELEIEIKRPWAKFKVEDDTICPHSPVLFTIDDLMYNTNYYWILEDLAQVESDSMYHGFNRSGDFTIGIHVEDSLIPGCEFNDALSINVKDILPDFDMSDKSTLCINDTIIIQDKSSLVDTYKWEINNQVVSTSTQVPPYITTDTGEVVVRLIVTNSIQCTDTLEKSIHTYGTPELNIPDYIYCDGTESIQITATSDSENYKFLWNNIAKINDRTITNPYVSVDTTTVFYLTATSQYNCVNSDSSIVQFLPKPTYTRSQWGFDTVIFIDQQLELGVTSSNPSQYSWEPSEFAFSPNEPTTIISIDDTTIFTVLIKDQCFTKTDSFNIIVHDGFVIDMPKAFRPSSFANNTVYVRGIGIAELISFQIFNRWGNLIFESDDLNHGWDGHYKGKLLPTGAYGWQVTVRSFRNEEHYLKGTILLLN